MSKEAHLSSFEASLVSPSPTNAGLTGDKEGQWRKTKTMRKQCQKHEGIWRTKWQNKRERERSLPPRRRRSCSPETSKVRKNGEEWVAVEERRGSNLGGADYEYQTGLGFETHYTGDRWLGRQKIEEGEEDEGKRSRWGGRRVRRVLEGRKEKKTCWWRGPPSPSAPLVAASIPGRREIGSKGGGRKWKK